MTTGSTGKRLAPLTSHVILPKPLLKRIPKSYFDPDEPGVLRILSDAEWRGIGITQSLGWEHYEVHGASSRLTSSGAAHSALPPREGLPGEVWTAGQAFGCGQDQERAGAGAGASTGAGAGSSIVQ